MANLLLIKILVFLNIVLMIFNWAFLAYILLSFFPINEDFFLIRVIRGICEPPYRLILRILPPLRIGMMDLSPIYVFVLIQVLQTLIGALVNHLGH